MMTNGLAEKKGTMKKSVPYLSLAVLSLSLAVLLGCKAVNQAGSDSTKPYDLSGSWELVATSTMNPGVVSYVEYVGSQSNGKISGLVQEFISTNGAMDRLTNCLNLALGNPQGDFSGTVDGSSITGTYNADPFVGGAPATFTMQCSITSSTSFSGNFASNQDNVPQCADAGTFVATKTSPLSGAYIGILKFYDGTGTMNLTATQDSAYNLTFTGTANGDPISFSGTVIGNLAVLNWATFNSSRAFAWWDAASQKLHIVNTHGYEFGFLVRQ